MPVFNNRANLAVNEIDLTEHSSLATLRNAAEYLGIGTGGSKETLWHKLNQQVQKIEHQQLFASANRLYKELNKRKGLDNQVSKNENLMSWFIFHTNHGVMFAYLARAVLMPRDLLTCQRRKGERLPRYS